MARFCKNCGCALPEGAAFCGACGTAADGPVNAVRGQARGGPGGAGPEAGKPGKGKTKRAAGAKKQNAFSARLKESLKAYFQNPLKLLPGIVLTLIWIVFSLLGNLGSSSPVMKVLNTLTYSSGGMYGGILGCVGGIFGKAFFSAIIISLVNALTEKKSSPARTKGAGMKGAALSGLKAVAPYLIGSGAGLALYWFFNVTATPKNLMVAVAGALAAVLALIRGRGLLFSLVSGVAGWLSKGKSPSLTAVKRTLTGFAAGFAAAVPATLLRRPWILISAGLALLAAGVVLALVGKDKLKRAAARAAVLLLVGSLLFPFAQSARAAGFDPDLAGDYVGTIQMVTGAVMDDGYANYTGGKEAYVSFVNKYLGGSPSKTLSRTEFDEKLDALIESSEIVAVDSTLRISSEDPASGKCTVSFSLFANNCKWKSTEDIYKLGSEQIEVTLTGTYADNKIEITEGSGDVLRAVGTIEFSKESGRITARSTDLAILVANQGVPTYAGGVVIEVEQSKTQPGSHGGASGITIDDIVGYYLYTGMNYETEEIEDFYFKIEKLSGSTFRFISLTPSSTEIPEIDWSALYADDENSEYIETNNNADLSVYRFDPGTATSETDESIIKIKVIEHYPEMNLSIETFNSETKSRCDIAFSRGTDGRIHAVYENHMDMGAGYSTLDHFDLVKVDHLPGEEPEPEPVPETEETLPEPETEPLPIETEPFVPETEAPESKPGPEPETPPAVPPDVEDPDLADLPDSDAGVVAESAATAIIGGGLGVMLGGIAGAIDGGGGPGGDGGSGGDPDLPSGWRVDSEGAISFEDPSTGKTVTYVQTGFNPDTGQPEYHNNENWGQGYDINDLKDMYERTSDERDYYKKINDTYQKTQEEQREDNQDLSWEAKDWEREKKENAERERLEDARNKTAYKRGVYDGNVKDFKKKVLEERGQIYQEQAKHEARAEYMNAGYQTAQSYQKFADTTIDVTEKIASKYGGPAIAAKAKAIKKGYIATKNAASNLGEYMAGTKNLKQAVADTAIGATGDLIKDSADGFGQKLLYNTTMEGGKTVYQGWVDGKSAEEIRDETIKKIEKATADTVNEATVGAVFGDTPTATLLTDLANMEANED